MNERPILFSGPMVRAILDGRKTQTRRSAKLTDAGRVRAVGTRMNWHPEDPNAVLACPYGAPGDRLWVKETWACSVWRDALKPTELKTSDPIEYRADYTSTGLDPLERGRWRPSIFMRRWMSRITLEITDVRVERLQDISEEDAKAEGCDKEIEHEEILTQADYDCGYYTPAYYACGFERLWQSINGPDSWSANPWVWVVTFKRVEP